MSSFTQASKQCDNTDMHLKMYIWMQATTSRKKRNCFLTAWLWFFFSC